MFIIKIGGGEKINIEAIIKDLSVLNGKFIIVHGANAFRDSLAEKLNKPKKTLTSVKGYSSVFTDEDAIDVMMMAYSGYKNKRIVELCQRNGINAVGLTGIDGRAVQGERNKGIRIRENNKLKIVRDFSGKPRSINADLLKLLLENGFTPVLTVPIIDENGYAINSENDDIVAVLQKELQAEKIIQFIEAPGYLENKDDADSVVKKMSKAELEQREAQVDGRMKRKILALRKLFEHGETTVIIADGRIDNPVTNALNGGGTIIQ
ncbi:MAG: [LysW]-aminoadipate kinase [Ignavibacteria bacterium]